MGLIAIPKLVFLQTQPGHATHTLTVACDLFWSE